METYKFKLCWEKHPPKSPYRALFYTFMIYRMFM